MTPSERASSAWSDAMLAAALFAIDPVGLGGVVLRSGPGPARDLWIAAMQTLLPTDAPVRRVPVRIEDERLLGGLDLTASLALGRPIVQRGVLAACHGGVAILSMAERMEDAAGARLAAVLDNGEVVIERDGLATRLPASLGLLALDEGREPDERPPDGLLDRLAFRIDLKDVGRRDRCENGCDPAAAADARRRLPTVGPAADAVVEALCVTSGLFGLASSRPALLALRAARAHAALAGRAEISVEDAAVAVRLVLAPRALTAPADTAPEEGEEAAEAKAEPPPEAPGGTVAGESETQVEAPASDAEMVIEAIKAALPDGLLDQVRRDGRWSARAARRHGSGAAVKSVRRGRPVGARHGALSGGDRLNLPETLRAATPWQRLRAAAPGTARVQVRQEDFRIRRFVQRQEATTIFLVDASGSAAFQRLSEAKGAVELLLAKAYVSRTRVALIAFRNTGAVVLLEPTRSLTRAKRSLADLPGGGGTPLAAGLESALLVAQAEKAKDRTPLIVILTDGRTNIGRGGAPGRATAESDAMAAARRLREAGVCVVFIDTSPRPQPDGDRFARAMGAVYAPLPYLEANAVSELVAGLSSARR
jgi:magnesium chelatase subunit D